MNPNFDINDIYSAAEHYRLRYVKIILNETFSSMERPGKFIIIDQAQVDGATWYTVSCSREVSIWLQKQSDEFRFSHVDESYMLYTKKFDIHEKLYSLMSLKWS